MAQDEVLTGRQINNASTVQIVSLNFSRGTSTVISVKVDGQHGYGCLDQREPQKVSYTEDKTGVATELALVIQSGWRSMDQGQPHYGKENARVHSAQGEDGLHHYMRGVRYWSKGALSIALSRRSEIGMAEDRTTISTKVRLTLTLL